MKIKLKFQVHELVYLDNRRATRALILALPEEGKTRYACLLESGGDGQKIVPVAEFDFEAVDARLDATSTEEMELLRLDDFNPERARRAAARHMKKGACGRRGLPKDIVRQMHRDYLRLGSLSKVARIYKRSRQSMWSLFTTHGLALNERKMNAMVRFGGRTFTPDQNGHYRESGVRDTPIYLHRLIWETKHGRKIPDGWECGFKDGDSSNLSPKNMASIPSQQVN